MTELPKRPGREYEYDLMRAVAALAVVMIHTCALRWRALDVQSADWLVLTLWNVPCKFCVPIFFMISGRFNLDPARQNDPRALFTRKIPRLLLAFLFWSCVYTAVNVVRTDDLAEDWKWIVIKFFTGEYHMWFLFAIIGLYLATPLLRPIAADEKKCRYFLLLWLVFQLLLPALAKLPRIGVFITTALDKMKLFYPLGFTGYYLLGWYWKEHMLTRRKRLACYLIGLVGTVFSTAAVVYASRTAGSADETLAEYLTWNVAHRVPPSTCSSSGWAGGSGQKSRGPRCSRRFPGTASGSIWRIPFFCGSLHGLDWTRWGSRRSSVCRW